MPTLLPWTTFELGDMDVFSPSLPSLAVYTWYVDDEPESSIVHFWQDEETGVTQSELLFLGPIAFEAAVAQAKEKAPERNVERIHVKHARSAAKAKSGAKPRRAAKPIAVTKQGKKAIAKPSTKAAATASKKKGARKDGEPLKRAARSEPHRAR
jgi:hypothetical protein